MSDDYFINEYIKEEAEGTGTTGDVQPDYDPYAGFYDYDSEEEDDDDEEEDTDENGSDEFTEFGDNDYEMFDDDEEDEEDEDADETDDENKDDGSADSTEDGKDSAKQDSQNVNSEQAKNNLNAGNTNKDAKGGDQKKDTSPIDFKWLVKFWNRLFENPATTSLCTPVNSAIRESIGVGTAGFSYLVTLVKPKYLTNTLGALLEIVDNPLVSTVVPARDLIDSVLKIQLIQGILQELRDKAMPLLEKGNSKAAVQGGGNKAS